MTTDIYDNISKDISTSTEEIFSTMIQMELDSSDSFMQDESMISTDIMSLVCFTGEYSGIIALFCPKEIALKLTSNMMGVSVTEIDRDTRDAVGEVTNMIAGALKNRVHNTLGAMHLSIPIVIGGANLTISSSGKESQKVNIPSSITCDTQSTWMMTPFSSIGHTFNIGIIVVKNG